ncbi:DUF2971 domain-containing protein [Mycobacterium asiaticum]|uniref:DUF2971 domain-containing protein n=1 Tax=Mycobacterium asiaticum TaxID=1790 RepID=UPI000A425EBF|nr:DUF2971 domain-containing protein [Mycobacterium asiaticum]
MDDSSVFLKDDLVEVDRTTPPPILYHYTNAQGLVGILPPNSWNVGHPYVDAKLEGAAQLQASDVRFMNDSEELRFGASVFERRFRAGATNKSIPRDVQALLQRLADTVSDPDLFGKGNLRCFAACFCESGDLLSQWRGYAGGLGGFAVGFTRDALTKHSYVMTPHFSQWGFIPLAVLKPVVYGDDDGEAAADNFIKLLQDPNAPELMRTSIGEPTMGFWMILQYVLQEIAVVKHWAFSEEKEWRLFWSGDQRWPPKIRPRASGLVPYLDIAVNAVKWTASQERSMTEEETSAYNDDPEIKASVDAEIDAIAKTYGPTVAAVVVGPGLGQPEQVVATRDLVRSSWNDPDVVRPSKVTYRG